MRRVVHISDLHFGNNDPALLKPLQLAIERIRPDVLVISGDFVEHATEDEFAQARAFIGQLPEPQIAVPGNHDLAFYNVVQRATVGLRNFKRYITDDLHPRFEDDELAIFGANTSRFWPLRGGSLSLTQLDQLTAEFAAVPVGKTRLLVTHHPFDLPEKQERSLIVGHARRSIVKLAPYVDILLAGHIHLSSTGSTANHYRIAGHAMTFVQAGTAVSNRNKGEENSFNAMRVIAQSEGGKAVIVHRYSWVRERGEFCCRQSTEYRLQTEGWARVEMPQVEDATVHEEPGTSRESDSVEAQKPIRS